MDYKKKKAVKKTLKTISLVIIIVIGGSVLKLFLNKKTAASEFPSGWELEDYESHMESKKDIPSDIKGMSQYDKYVMGLDYHDGSDSDQDGLTDKEEIELYKTDPLKASTAGDLYTDGYKVSNKMDPLKKADYKEEISINDDGCSEVKLNFDEPGDLNTVIKDVTKDYDLSAFNIDKLYKGYWINGYNGSLSIDVNDIITKRNIKIKDIHVYIVEGAFVTAGLSELVDCDFNNQDNILNLNYEFEGNNNYHIFIGSKKRISIGGIINSSSASTNKATPTEVNYLLYGSTLASEIGHKSFKIAYTGSNDQESKDAFREQWKKLYKDATGADFLFNIEMEAVSEAALKKKYERLQRMLPFMETNVGEPQEIYMLAFAYIYDENVPSSIDTEIIKKTDFDVFTDELPFQNFGSYIGEHGNCAGITHLTAYLYNKGKLPSSGSYKCPIDGKEQKVKWDLATDSENSTLTDPGLYDYKSSNFVDDNSGKNSDRITADLSAGEEEFINMVGCFWAEGNDKISLLDYMNTDGARDNYSKIEKMIKCLDEGKILDVYMYFQGGFGHAINIYDYHYNSLGEVFFSVYDSNIPQDQRAGFTLNHGKCYLEVQKIENEDGPDTFEYLYWPISGKNNISYMATSNPNLMAKNAIVVMDEEWNIIE